jgi:hypothetical protein
MSAKAKSVMKSKTKEKYICMQMKKLLSLIRTALPNINLR